MKFIVLLNRYGTPMLLVDEDENAVVFNRYGYANKQLKIIH